MKKKACLLLLLSVLGALLLGTAAAECGDYHPFGPWKTKRAATCHAAGIAFRYCRNCDHWEQKDLPRLPHTPGEWTVILGPTCTHHGREETYCTVCGDRIRRTIDALPHAEGERSIDREPTCTADGRAVYVCESCGKKRYETIPKLGHDDAVVSVTKEATCKAAGAGTLVCQRCGREKKATLDRLEHEFGEWTVLSEPDGKKKGTREHTCALCGVTEQERFYLEGTLYEDMPANEAVIRMQEMLRDLGLYNGAIRTGKFGEMTTKAVASFQKKVGLKSTGVADPETLERLESEWNKRFSQAE